MKQLTFLSLSFFPPFFVFTCALLVTQPLFIHVCDFPSLFIGSSVFPALLLFPVASWFVLSFFGFFFTLWFILGFSFACLFAANFLVPCLSIACILNFGLGLCHKSLLLFCFSTCLPFCLSFGSFTPPEGLGNPSLDHLQETINAMI